MTNSTRIRGRLINMLEKRHLQKISSWKLFSHVGSPSPFLARGSCTFFFPCNLQYRKLTCDTRSQVQKCDKALKSWLFRNFTPFPVIPSFPHRFFSFPCGPLLLPSLYLSSSSSSCIFWTWVEDPFAKKGDGGSHVWKELLGGFFWQMPHWIK